MYILSTKQYCNILWQPKWVVPKRLLKCQTWHFYQFYIYQLFSVNAETCSLYLFCLSNNGKSLKNRILPFIIAQSAQSAQKQKAIKLIQVFIVLWIYNFVSTPSNGHLNFTHYALCSLQTFLGSNGTLNFRRC